MMKKIIYTSGAVCVALILAFSLHQDDNNTPPKGFIPDEKTAIDIAKILLVKSYGDDMLKMQYGAHLNKDSTQWVVENIVTVKSVPPVQGGSVQMVIQKKDCRVLRLAFGK